MTLRQKMKYKLRQRFHLWLDKRQPASAEVKLRQHLLFVFPTAYGGWFVLLIALLYLFGSNYQNNLILLCAYLLFSLFCFCIIAAFVNLHRLTIKAGPAPYGYAGTEFTLPLSLSGAQHRKMLRWSGDDFAELFFETLPEELPLGLHPQQRGFYQLKRFTLQSCYPFGLIRCWTHIQLQQFYWIYPEPAGLQQSVSASAASQQEYPDQLVPYQMGDPVSAIDWKRLAKTPWQPVIRHYSSSNEPAKPNRLVVNTTGVALEQQLCEFCTLLHQFEQQGQSYSLSTPTTEIGPDHGQFHLHRCLQALTLC